jgi:hypothetical protein
MSESSQPTIAVSENVPDGDLAQCLRTLRAAFGKSVSDERLANAAYRLSQAGFSKDHRKNFLSRMKTLEDPEMVFLEKMTQREFAVEHIILFVEAPVVATSFAERSRQQIMKEIQNEWELAPLSSRLEKGVATKNKPVGALIALEGGPVLVEISFIKNYPENTISVIINPCCQAAKIYLSMPPKFLRPAPICKKLYLAQKPPF